MYYRFVDKNKLFTCEGSNIAGWAGKPGEPEILIRGWFSIKEAEKLANFILDSIKAESDFQKLDKKD